ncbi:unnamed protein product [Camellia sinensis]
MVRKESAYLAGWVSWGEADKQKTMALENLKADCKSLKRKIVFRSDPRKFVKLKYECEEFLKMVVTSVGLIKDVDSMDKQQISDQVRNWQLEIWKRHKKKVYFTIGVLGSGYLLYKLYDAHKRRLSDLERELAQERENDELIKAHMQAHFGNIQRIADTATLPHSMLYLSSRVAEELDLLHLTEQLIRGKGQSNSLSSSKKLELCFTRMVLSLWAMTMLSLYIRVLVNILGKHLYIDTARDLGSSHLLDEADLIDRNDQQQFLASADFLSNYGMPTLISNMQAAASEVLKGKQLKDLFNTTVLHETTVQILDMFMSMGSPHHWVDYLMPEDPNFYKLVAFSNSDSTDPSDSTKFDRLMVETRAVLSRLLDKTFDEFASLWMNIKVEVKTKEDHEARQFKFKARAFKIENIMEIDISTLGGSLENEILSDWQELLSDEKVAEKRTVDGIAHGVISLTGRIRDINFKAAEFPTLSNTTGLVRLVLRNCNISAYLVDAYDKERFAEAKKELDALHKKQQRY